MKHIFILFFFISLTLFLFCCCENSENNILTANSNDKLLELFQSGINQNNANQIFNLYYLKGSDSIAIEQIKIFSKDIIKDKSNHYCPIKI